MSQPAAPKAPDSKKLYKQGIKLQTKYLPQLIQQEQAARNQYDPQRIAEQQQLQGIFGPTQYAQQLQALAMLDPESMVLRRGLANAVGSDLELGGQLSPEMNMQLEQQIRGAQTARGNAIGNAPASAEALWKTQGALNLYQQRLQNVGNFLNSPTPEQQLLAVQPVTADRGAAYTNPAAGLQMQQFGLQNYGNLLAQYQLSGGGRNPWASALGGAASGAAAGGTVGGGYGAAAGAVLGGVSGYFSDQRLKRNIKPTGKTAGEVPIVEFEYIEADFLPKGKWRGVIAQTCYNTRPDCVFVVPGTPLLAVNYDKLGVKLEKVE